MSPVISKPAHAIGTANCSADGLTPVCEMTK